ncbi:MAG: MarR family transcriptional regulator [Firmicutes bacterium]|jgi:DNA-binding MarR family transcriptional regulator|nr:MarR family transcriptional regulator [Bacillota bacterium]
MNDIAKILNLLRKYDNEKKEYHKTLRTGGWDVTGAQVNILRIVNQEPGICVSHLSEIVGIHITTAQGYVDRLLSKKLIKMEIDPADRRRKLLFLTAEGEKVIRNVPLAYKPLLLVNLQQATAEERQVILAGLELILRFMQRKDLGNGKNRTE